MLQRRDDPDFWQSVTGSLESGESPSQAAQREVKEEVGIDIVKEHLTLTDCQRCVEFELFAHLRHRYAPGVTRNLEHWFCLPSLLSGRSRSANIWPTVGWTPQGRPG